MDEYTKNDEIIQNTTNQILKTAENTIFQETVLSEFDAELNSEFSDDLKETLDTNFDIEKTSNESNTPEKIDIEDANTTNCLALTIKEEHKLVAVKNVFIHSLKVTWKVIVSTIALHLLKIFF